MPTTVYQIKSYKVQILAKEHGDLPRPCITVRLYDDTGKIVGTAVFKDYGSERPAEPPVGKVEDGTATAFFDITFYDAFIGVLRYEDELYWKIAWRTLGAVTTCSDASLDTKKEVIGDFFPRTP